MSLSRWGAAAKSQMEEEEEEEGPLAQRLGAHVHGTSIARVLCWEREVPRCATVTRDAMHDM